MATEAAPARTRATWPVLAGAACVIAAGAAAAFFHWPEEAPPAPQLAATPGPAVPVAATPPKPAEAPAEAVRIVPSFDVVRVSPEGSAVIAGRAPPGAEVVVRDGEREFGRGQADRRGEFVIIPDAKLQPGGRELTLAALGSGGAEVKGRDSVLVIVPPPVAPALAAPSPSAPSPSAPSQAAPAALALLVPQGGAAPRLLQAPGRKAKLSLDAVDYDERGEMRFSGYAPQSATLRIYVDNQPVGEAKADAQGQWSLTPSFMVPIGLHRLRVDEFAAGSGRVTGRVELPFQRTLTTSAEIAHDRVVVQPGQNLWRIARSAYGTGVRYTVIYLANKDAIRDPRLIYPGQVLATPAP